jgi:hypothetical protein
VRASAGWGPAPPQNRARIQLEAGSDTDGWKVLLKLDDLDRVPTEPQEVVLPAGAGLRVSWKFEPDKPPPSLHWWPSLILLGQDD